ncbi:hypothetical protein [Bacillus cereus group sp. BfR-BA-01380]|uniref:hypothetical protein n=1 Tax=Bacillus cereus group sp. BfR-BA-01380 TaxID=2920324 RepID=UPI001F588235|nr:hypothetical protein [Bacillus cereus group sp. BfR-BA-01380]
MHHVKENRLYSGVYGVIFFPIFFGIISFSTWTNIGIYIISIVLLDIIITATSYFLKLENNLAWRIYFVIIQFDLSCVFVLIASWYRWESKISIGIGIVGCFVLCKIIGFAYREVILKEALNPKTIVGKIVYGIGFIGGGAAGFSGHIVNTELNKNFGDKLGGDITMGIMSVGLLLLAMFFQSTHYKIEYPDFDGFEKENKRQKNF